MSTFIGPLILGGFLIFLSVPLFIGSLLTDGKNKMWMRLGILMAGAGALVVICGGLAFIFL